MNRKIFNVAVSFALMFSMLGAVACTTAVDQSEKIEYTLDGAENLTASFGEPYSAPQYKILRNGTDTGYKAKLQSVTDPDGEAVTVSYSSFTLGQIGTYTMTYYRWDWSEANLPMSKRRSPSRWSSSRKTRRDRPSPFPIPVNTVFGRGGKSVFPHIRPRTLRE